MWTHLGHFIGFVLGIFFNAIGTTLLGRIVDIAFAASIGVAVLYQKKQEGGWRLMFNDWREEYKAGLKFALWAAVLIYTPVVLWSVGRAVYSEHQNLVGATARINSSLHTKVAATESALAVKQLECARQEGRNETLENQNRDQQGSINGCLTQAIKLISQEVPPLHITNNHIIGVLPQSPRKGFKFAMVYLVMTNKPIAPTRLLVTCEADIEADGELLGAAASTRGGWGGRGTRNNHQYGIGILTPTWTTFNPIVVTVYSNAQQFGLCSFDEQ